MEASAEMLMFMTLVIGYIGQAQAGSFVVDNKNATFLLDGRPFRYVSGSMHYARVPPEYWKDRLTKMRAAGLNAVQTYVPWNIHEVAPGQYDFSGYANLEKFLVTAQDAGLYVLLRAGPYICGEWEFGGFPAWLLTEKPDMILRTMDPDYIKYVDKWFSVLLPKVKPYLFINGGPILMVQIENEYGSYFACDRNYTAHLRDLFWFNLGKNVTLYTTDGDSDGFLKCGYVEGAYATVDFGVTCKVGLPSPPPPLLQFIHVCISGTLWNSNILKTVFHQAMTDHGWKGSKEKTIRVPRLSGVASVNPAGNFQSEKDYEPHGPSVNSEYYTGWLDHWGSPHSELNPWSVSLSLEMLLHYGANVNMYMFEGGTNFGYWNGANFPPYAPVPTSYDYDSPLNESGDITEKFNILRKIISLHLPVPPVVPPDTPKYAYGNVTMTFVSTVQDALTVLSPGGFHSSLFPVPMEQIKHYYGFILYRTSLPKDCPSGTILDMPGIRDRAYVSLNQVPVGVFSRTGSTTGSIAGNAGDLLDILVENQGRINYGTGINYNQKGLILNVTLGNDTLKNWKMYPINLENVNSSTVAQLLQHQTRLAPIFKEGNSTPSLYIGTVKVTGEPKDTFLDPRPFSKGQALINGFNLGRYWPTVGPQVRLYVPAPVLTPGISQLVLLELEGSPCQDDKESCSVYFSDKPFLNKKTASSQRITRHH